MPNLSRFSESDVAAYGEEVGKIAAESASMEEAADKIVRHLSDSLTDEEGGRACALVRFYKTHAYGDLDRELQGFAQGVLGHAPESLDMKCLTLLGTAGEKEEWNSRQLSAGHKAIPLPSADFVSQIPMISRLVSQLGLEVQAMIRPDPSLIVDLEQKSYNAFHVPEAVGSPYIPAQEEFVIPYGVRSVLGFGGVFKTGDLFAVILFSKTPISRETSDRFKSLAVSVKEATQPFLDGRVFV